MRGRGVPSGDWGLGWGKGQGAKGLGLGARGLEPWEEVWGPRGFGGWGHEVTGGWYLEGGARALEENGWMDIRLEILPLCSIQHRPLWVHCPKKRGPLDTFNWRCFHYGETVLWSKKKHFAKYFELYFNNPSSVANEVQEVRIDRYSNLKCLCFFFFAKVSDQTNLKDRCVIHICILYLWLDLCIDWISKCNLNISAGHTNYY